MMRIAIIALLRQDDAPRDGLKKSPADASKFSHRSH